MSYLLARLRLRRPLGPNLLKRVSPTSAMMSSRYIYKNIPRASKVPFLGHGFRFLFFVEKMETQQKIETFHFLVGFYFFVEKWKPSKKWKHC
jgi:hypothetical protein